MNDKIPAEEFERMWRNRFEEGLVSCVYKGHRMIAVGATLFIENLDGPLDDDKEGEAWHCK